MADFSINGEAKLNTSGVQSALNTITGAAGKALSGLTTAAAGAMATGAAAAAALAKQALKSYATYEQAIGGVETLYKDSARTIIQYAENAYKTAGVSANDYMNTVTSFAASLVSSLRGDTAQAAELANMAITDMADNANKMGTEMQSIQNAYQGFAKQNYTMLDNLKLGYGGTKEEMQRLLQDAEMLSGIHFELGNYADMVQAIHIIQANMGVAGTTAKEAATTIQGSLASLRAAWSNLLTGIADDNANVAALMGTLTGSFATAAGNVLPRLIQIFEGMGEAVTEAAPAIAAQIPAMVESLLPSFLAAAASLAANIAAQLPAILEAVAASAAQVMADTGAKAAYSLITGFAEILPLLITEGMSALASLADYLTAHMDVIFDIGLQLLGSIIEGIRDGLPDLLFSAAKLVTAFGVEILNHADEILDVGIQLVFAIIEGIANAVADFGEAALGLIARFLHLWDGNMDQFGQIGTNAVQSLINGILGKKNDAQNAAADVYNAVQAGFSGMGGGQSGGGGAGRGGSVQRSLAAHDQSYWEQVGQHFKDTGQVGAIQPVTVAVDDLSGSLNGLNTSASKAAQETETLADKLEKADKALSESQSAYKTLTGAVDEYNETGSISLATWQNLMDLAPEYQALLVQEGDKLKLNQAAYNDLITAQRLEIETLSQQNGVLPETIQLIDSLGITAEKTADEAQLAAKRLKGALEKLSGDWSDSYLAKLQSLASDIQGGNFGDALLDAGEIAWKKLDTATQQQLVDMAQGWLDTLETAFAQDGFEGLVKAGKTIADSLVTGLQDTSSVTGALIDNVLGQVGISGGVEGLLSVITELGPVVLGVVAAAAAVAAAVVGVASAFSYTVEQSRALQAAIQELTADGQALTDELSAALDVLQPFIEQSSKMLDQLDQIASMISDTFTGIGIEIMETMIPMIQQILDTILPVLVDLQPALEAVGDLLRTLLDLFGDLASCVLTGLQPILQSVGPLLETLALLLNSVASVVSALLSPALKALGELLNWLLQPILWVARAINQAVEWVVGLINPILKFLGLGGIELPDDSVGKKGQAAGLIKDNNRALEDNTDALKENNALIRNPPSYQIGAAASSHVGDYAALLAEARAEVLRQNLHLATNYDAGSGSTQARLNASWRGESTTILELDGREVAKATRDYMDEELAF